MKNKAQASIEFSIGLVIAILFLILTCNLFVWFNHCLVRRQVAYEQTRVEAGDGRDKTLPFPFSFIITKRANPGRSDFYTPPELHIFSPGGRE